MVTNSLMSLGKKGHRGVLVNAVCRKLGGVELKTVNAAPIRNITSQTRTAE